MGGGQRLEGEDLRLRPQAGRKQRELAATGDIDDAREISPGECARVLDGCGDTVAQARTKAAIGQGAATCASGARVRPRIDGRRWRARSVEPPALSKP